MNGAFCYVRIRQRSSKRIIQHDRVITIRTSSDQRQAAAGEFFHRTQISASGGRQFVPVADAGGGFFPAGEFQVDRLAFVPAVRVERGQFAAQQARWSVTVPLPAWHHP